MVTDDPALLDAFKTPSLRNVALRPPGVHAGQFSSVEEVIVHDVKPLRAVIGRTELSQGGPGHSEREPIRLSEHERMNLASFLGTLSGPGIDGLLICRKPPCPVPQCNEGEGFSPAWACGLRP